MSIVRDGQIIDHGTLAELRHLTRTSLHVETELPLEGIEDVAGVHEVLREGNHAQLQVDSGTLDPVLAFLVERRVQSLVSTPPTLEDLFLRHYGSTS
jgi:ABC-2 type transport system ATP-binding protein